MRAKQLLCYHVVFLPLTCVAAVSPHVNSIVVPLSGLVKIMGAWGINSLENDDGAGWFEEFFDEPSETLLFKAFTSVNSFGDNYVEYTESAEALAAAEIVAGLLGNSNSTFLSEDQERIRSFKLKPNAELVAAAQKAVERVKTNSELKELWDESDSAAKWQATVENLFERLKQ